MPQDLSQIMQLAEQAAQPLGIAVVEVRMSQQGKRRSLEVTIYRRGGRIALADCEQVSRRLEEALEAQSPPLLEGSYLLDVQSPGIDRKLSSEREYGLFSGLKVDVKTKQKVAELESDHITGLLGGLTNGQVLLKQAEKAIDRGIGNKGAKGKSMGKAGKSGKSAKQAVQTAPVTELKIEVSNLIQVRLADSTEAPSAEAIEL